jgi:hypothetical protein
MYDEFISYHPAARSGVTNRDVYYQWIQHLNGMRLARMNPAHQYRKTVLM